MEQSPSVKRIVPTPIQIRRVETHKYAFDHFEVSVLCVLGWWAPGTDRNEIARRFQPLIVMTASVRFTSSSSEKLCFANSYMSSGTWPSAIRVRDSVHARAARSRAVKNGVSRHEVSSVQTLFRLTLATGIFCVDINTVGTSIDP